MKYEVNGRGIDLTDKHYKAEGGQAKIYVRDGIAYKIFHDPSKMIAPAKIRELSQLKLANVLAPQHVVKNSQGREVGFSMPSADNFEFLCKLFSKGFRNRNKITPQNIVELIKRQQLTLQQIHDLQFLVVDYNEMNFLVDNKTYENPFFIDVDSYQTPSFPADALMSSVRDRQVVNQKFTTLSDWFSWGIVTFKTYIGVHPFGGEHPAFGGEGVLDKRMDAGISVFDKAIKLPPACQDFSVIPKAHLDWFKRTFVRNERTIPPMADPNLILAAPVTKLVSGNEKFAADEEAVFMSDILGVEVINGSRYYLTDASVFQEKVEVLKFSTRDKIRGIIPAGVSFAIAEVNKYSGTVVFCDASKNLIGEIAGDNFSLANGCIYTTNNGKLIENSFVTLGARPVHQTLIVGDVFAPNAKLFQGVVLQDMLGQAFATIPFVKGSSASVKLPELNGKRIIDAKYLKGFLVVIAEQHGAYERFVFKIDTSTHTYTCRVTPKVDLDVVNFTVLQNGLCILVINDKRVEAFFDNVKVKSVDKPPFDSEDALYSEGNKVMVIKGSKLYKITLK